MEKAEIQALIREAFAAQKFAYVPYSHFHAGAAFAFKQNTVQLFHIGACLHQGCCSRVGFGTGAGKPEAAGVRGDAGVQAVCHVRVDGHAHHGDQLGQNLAAGGGIGVQIGAVGIGRIAAVMVDAQVHIL